MTPSKFPAQIINRKPYCSRSTYPNQRKTTNVTEDRYHQDKLLKIEKPTYHTLNENSQKKVGFGEKVLLKEIAIKCI